ncbi:STAS-like domain-containing protein [Lacticaseibacillus paracasei subsp. tolerans]|uniref:STAS-like domain-containing protein n=1 Tax=Lacticaseibacillus paracasei TaxID=1597 RepID=UPI0018AD47FF|nr:STAS-like domain-containing protein [Lacticaseibacillus paracasei]QPI89299.1 STAS-like domain-containing protein [Lacticaseibacillus paracasei subsp. tolerans]
MKTLNIKAIIKNDLAVTPEDGELIFKLLNTAIDQKNPIEVNFSGLRTVTTAFLNASIGDLYEKWDSTTLNHFVHLQVNTMTPLQIKKAQSVMENARIKLSQEEIQKDLGEG